MHNAFDRGVTNTLGDFEGALRTAQEQLDREEARLVELERHIDTASKTLLRTRREIKEMQERVEAADGECVRMSRMSDQRREQLTAQTSSLEALRADRIAVEHDVATTRADASSKRQAFCDAMDAVACDILNVVRTQDPAALRVSLAEKETALQAALGRVEKHRSDLETVQRAAEEAKRAAPPATIGATTTEAPSADPLVALQENLSTVESKVAAQEQQHAERMTALGAARDGLRATVRAAAHQMVCAEQEAHEAARRYTDMLDQSCAVSCRQCGGDLGFEPLA